ncbi:MAG: prepilin peptidase [Alicyclobacillus herbarius]|uniref:prepilin peptidase n=1 Tax=Alicyclobacillus herbarius TaxID=122960 RepID=UPI000836D67F|nr:prepilin peptidase [Alicyclobacillus herbarius]MCL6633335.1 prepilin peptidase [Alicyclobacillus herbarius]
MLRFMLTVLVGLIVLAVAAVEDRRSFTVSLPVVMVGWLSGMVLAVVFGGWRGLCWSLAGIALGLFLGATFSVLLRMGWGDTLLYGMIGATFGPVVVLLAFAITNSLVLMRFLLPVIRRQRARIAVAPYILLGTLGAVAWSHML